MFEITKRRALIVYINNRRVIRALRHYGSIEYVSRRMHYVVLYIDQADIDTISTKVQQMRAVRRVEQSLRPDLDPTLANLEGLGIYQLHDEDD